MAACSRAAFLNAVGLLVRMRHNYLLPDVISHSSDILASEKGGKWRHASLPEQSVHSCHVFRLSKVFCFPAAYHGAHFCYHRLREGWACTRTATSGKHWDCVYGCDTIISLLDVIRGTSEIIAGEQGGQWQQALGLLQECDTMFFSGRCHQLQICNHRL